MNKKENLIMSDYLKEAMYNVKISLRGNDVNDFKMNYYHLEKTIQLMDSLNVDIDKDILKLDKNEFKKLMSSYGHTDVNYCFSINDLLYGDYNQLLNDISNTCAWDKLNLLIDKALLHGLIIQCEYEVIKDMMNEYV